MALSMEPMKVRIYSQPWDGATHIAFLIQRNGQWCIAKPVELVFEPLVEGAVNTPPTMTLHSEVAHEFFKAMAQALDDRGIKTDSDAKIAGTLEATRYHLDDLRNMVYMLMSPQSEDHNEH